MIKSRKIIAAVLCVLLVIIAAFILKGLSKAPSAVEVKMTEVLSDEQSTIIPPLINDDGIDLSWIRKKETNLTLLIADRMEIGYDDVHVTLAAKPDLNTLDTYIFSCSIGLAVNQAPKEEVINDILDLVVEEVSETGPKQAIIHKEDIAILDHRNEVLYP